jgi:sialate O-acetylesterase
LWALAKDYGQEDLVYSGPLYKSMTVEGDKIRIAFDHVDGGLVSRDGQPLTHFTIAGDDKNFVEAQAEIDGDSVVVQAQSVSQPVAVRFGWHQEAEPNLSNKAGLPASPFRTDK